MNIARNLYPLSRKNVGRTFYRNFRISSSSKQTTAETQPQVQEEKFSFEDLRVLERTERRKPRIEPFMKNVYVSNFNRDLLAYPEILDKDETSALNTRLSKLDEVFSNPEKSANDRENALKGLSIYAGPVSLTKGGLAFNTTERLQYLDTVSNDLEIAKQISDHWVGLEALKQGLLPEDYDKVLLELMDGTNKIVLCMREPLSTRIKQDESIHTKAEMDGQGLWWINGIKECRNVKKDNFLLVLCSIEAKRIRAFLVHPSAHGLNINDSQVVFNKTPAIPLEHITENQLAAVMGLSRLDAAVICYNILKRAIVDCAKYVRGKFVAGQPLADVDSLRARVGAAVLRVYAAESAAYHAAGLRDGYESPDCDLEMALCRSYMCAHAPAAAAQLLAVPGFESGALSALRAALAADTEDNVHMFIAMNAMHHAGRCLAEEIRQVRNPLFHPAFIMRKAWANRHQEKDDPKLTLHLCHHLHPSLRRPADALEYCALRLRYACEVLLARRGLELHRATAELQRLSAAGAEVYAMVAALSRASRAYCIGLRNAEIEMKMAATIVEEAHPVVKKLILDIENGEYLNQDHTKIEFGRKVMDTGTMLVEKPIERVFW